MQARAVLVGIGEVRTLWRENQKFREIAGDSIHRSAIGANNCMSVDEQSTGDHIGETHNPVSNCMP